MEQKAHLQHVNNFCVLHTKFELKIFGKDREYAITRKPSGN